MDFFEQVVRGLPEPVLIVSREGMIEWVNSAALAFAGGRPLEPGTPLTALVLDDAKEVRDFLRLCSLTSGITLGSLSLRGSDGAAARWRCEGSALRDLPSGSSSRQLLLRLRTLQSASERFALLNQKIEDLSREIRERRRIEREFEALVLRERQARDGAERANRLKDEFLSTLSHELRTPLNAIVGWTHLMRADPQDAHDTHRRGLETIERNARLQSQLIHDLLDLSRIASGKLRLSLQAVELPRVLEEARESLRPAAEAKRITLRTQFEPEGATISGDPARLRQIVWNLLSNAVKFTPEGGSVELALRRAGTRVEIEVSDDGRGIASDVLPYVFDRFRQGDSSSTRQHGGLGLGLAIVRYLTELHGGTATAESAGEGRGARFTVSLPAPSVQHRLFHESEGRTPAFDAAALQQLSVLVVEDDPDSRELLVTLLERSGAVVHAVASAADGLRAFEQQRPALVISDLEMPGEDGYALLRQLRERAEYDGPLPPVIALTAYARPEDRERALRAGFQLHLGKPVDPTELLDAIASLLGSPRLRRPPSP